MSSKERRKSDKSSTGIVTLTVPPEKLRAIFKSSAGATKSTTLSSTSTPTPSTPLPSTSIDNHDTDVATPTAPPSPDNKDNKHLNVASSAIDSMPSTPSGNHGAIAAGAETPGGTPMAPPNGQAGDSPLKKKGVKRSAAAAGVDGTGSGGPGSVNGDTPAPAARVRSKPGPKKKAKLDDSMVEIKGGAGGAHKLGPKASMGAINAGLRALDRSGKPCRKWAKRGFRLKSFTGVSWVIPRWKAPPKHSLDISSAEDNIKETDSAAAAAGAAGTPADIDMLNAPTPSAEPATAAATPVAA